MFRTPVGEFSLSSGRKAAPSYQPALEALEERIVLNDTGSMTADFSGLTAIVQELTPAVQAFTRSLNRKLSQAGEGALSVAKAVHLANQYDRILTAIDRGIAANQESLVAAGGSPDAAYLQAVSAYNVAINQFNAQLGRAALLDQVLRTFIAGGLLRSPAIP